MVNSEKGNDNKTRNNNSDNNVNKSNAFFFIFLFIYLFFTWLVCYLGSTSWFLGTGIFNIRFVFFLYLFYGNGKWERKIGASHIRTGVYNNRIINIHCLRLVLVF